MTKVDIIDVMIAVHRGELRVSIQNGFFLLEHIKSGERVRLNESNAIEVVHCRECKWFAENNGGEWYGCSMFNAIRAVPEDAPSGDDFCSYGEKRGDKHA